MEVSAVSKLQVVLEIISVEVSNLLPTILDTRLPVCGKINSININYLIKIEIHHFCFAPNFAEMHIAVLCCLHPPLK